MLSRFFCDAFGEMFGSAGLAAEADQERFQFFWKRVCCLCAMRAGEEADEITVQPRALLSGKRRALRNEWDVAAHSSKCSSRTAALL